MGGVYATFGGRPSDASLLAARKQSPVLGGYQLTPTRSSPSATLDAIRRRDSHPYLKTRAHIPNMEVNRDSCLWRLSPFGVSMLGTSEEMLHAHTHDDELRISFHEHEVFSGFDDVRIVRAFRRGRSFFF